MGSHGTGGDLGGGLRAGACARTAPSADPGGANPPYGLEEIEHRTTRVKRPQSNGIVERLHRTLLDERFRVEGRRTWFEAIEEMQTILDD